MPFIVSLLGSLSSAYAVPVQLTQQGRLLDSGGAAVIGQQTMSFRVYDDPFGTVPLWQEILTVNFVNGYYAAILGADPNNPFDNGVLDQAPLYMELEVGNNGPLSPRQPINSTPYAKIASQAQSVNGGVVNASELQIGGSLVIDAGGGWVGPTIAVDWANLSNIPTDFADGDDDTLAGITCATEQILSWDGSVWVCTDNNGLTESEVEDYVTNNALDLASGTSVSGSEIVTIATDQDSFADLGLSCQSGDVPKYDNILGWQCALDNDTADWQHSKTYQLIFQMALTTTPMIGQHSKTSPVVFKMVLRTRFY